MWLPPPLWRFFSVAGSAVGSGRLSSEIQTSEMPALAEAASMLDTASCWNFLMGHDSHPITPLPGVLGEPPFHSGHSVFRWGPGGHGWACVYLCCWAFSSLEDPSFFPDQWPVCISWTRLPCLAPFLCSHAAAHRGGGGGAAFHTFFRPVSCGICGRVQV